jgi:site-specific recombinase XerD
VKRSRTVESLAIAEARLPPLVEALLAEDVTASSSTAYRGDLAHFVEWCNHHGEDPLPCSVAALVHFLTEHAEGYSMATVERRAAAVSWAHRKAGYLGKDNPRQSPLVTEALRLLRRRYRETKQKQAKELTVELVREVVGNCKRDKKQALGLRDRAMILLGFAGAFRRSELVSLRVEDLKDVPQGVEVTVRWSKTDQEGNGITKKIARGHSPATCPVTALRDWLELSKITSGPLFRRVFKSGAVGPNGLSGQAFYDVIKKRMLEVGIDDWNDFSSHSVRSGFASTAAEHGASLQSIKGQGGWKSDSVALGYIRKREDWESAASFKLGL